jgi:O-methyltransferase
MKKFIIQLNIIGKTCLLFIRPHSFLAFLTRPMLMLSNLISMSKWIASQEKTDTYNDFFTWGRDYSKRYKLYNFVLQKLQLQHLPIDYIEMGVCGGDSFKWWLSNNDHPESTFYGFDTFEGLPESWGAFDKGDMAAGIPQVNDTRAFFLKGLFQQSLPPFLEKGTLKNNKRKIIHLDADLFSSTLFSLTALAPYLKRGDILLFDEFNVPTHEYMAFKVFCESHYVQTKLIGAVNNYYQIAVMITER